jgi:hypothetical protein
LIDLLDGEIVGEGVPAIFDGCWKKSKKRCQDCCTGDAIHSMNKNTPYSTGKGIN